MTTLVTPREVIDLAFADGGYLPPEAIGTVDIAAAEARYLLPVTGPALWLISPVSASLEQHGAVLFDYVVVAVVFAQRTRGTPSDHAVAATSW